VNTSFLVLEDIRKRFGRTAALDAISLDVAQGEFLTLLGPSGSGKSTLLSILAGFLPPDHGAVRLRGADITHAPPEQRRFGVVPQGYGLFPHLTVRENVAFPLKVRGTDPRRRDTRVDEVLDLVQIGALHDRLPKALSGGQQQRVALARALAFEPDVLLLDEPLSALDALLRRDLHAELVRLHRRVGTTFIHVTHDQQEALALSDRVVVLDGGRIEQIGTPRSLYARPATRFVANFLGKNNLLPATVARASGTSRTVVWNGLALEAGGQAPASGNCTLAIRPEDIRVVSATVDAPLPAGHVPGIVTGTVFHGASADLTVAVGADSVTVLHREVLAREHRQDPRQRRDRQRVPLPRQRAQPPPAG
jgi:putative spermidine/putrescine transport system ATP-binding protein